MPAEPAPARPLVIDIVEDQRLIRDLLAEGLKSRESIDVRHLFASAEDALAVWVTDPPEAAVVDITLPGMNGVNAGVQLKRAHRHVAVVLVSSHAYPTLFARLPVDVNTGWGYLLKDDVSIANVLDAIEQCLADRNWQDPTLATHADAVVDLSTLSHRQLEILDLLARGRSNDAIASELRITRKSVENALNRIYPALGLGDDDKDTNRRVAASALSARFLRIAT